MGSVLLNVRYAARVLGKSPTFTLTAVLCLGSGIGANTALFGIFNTLLWKPLAVSDPGRLVRLYAKAPTESYFYRNFSYPEYVDYRQQEGRLAGLIASTGVQVAFRASGGDAMRVYGEAVSDNYFEVLGLRPKLGRLLATPADGGRNVAPEVVLSERFWRSRLGAAPNIVGKTIRLTGAPYTVVGVTPREFTGTYAISVMAPELWVPLGTVPQLEPGSAGMFENRAALSLTLLGRLNAGVTVAETEAAFNTVAARLARDHPRTNAGVRVLVFRELDTRPEVYNSRVVNLVAVLFLGLAALVLVVACANLANLMLARAAARRKEIAVRLALGARRGQLVQQLAAEALVLSAAAAVVGLLAGWVAARAVSSVRLPTDIPIVFDVAIDLRALVFTLTVSLLSGLAFGLGPALGASRGDLVPALKGGEAPTSRRRRRFTAANVLVVAQVAVSLALLITAALFWRSIAGSRTIDPGLQLANRTLVSFSPSLVRYDSPRAAAFYRTLLDWMRQAPEVEEVALASWLPLGFAVSEGRYEVEGRPAGPRNEDLASFVNVVSPGYLATVGVTLRQGRGFTDQDTASTLWVALVNEEFARRAWPGRNPLGRRLRRSAEKAEWLTVVGVVADGKYRTLTEAPRPCLLVPLAQTPADSLTLVVRTRAGHAAALSAVKREVRALDAGMPLLDVKTMEQQLAKVRFLPQAMTALAGPASGLAILIAAIGLYGVIACSVGRRAREFGIRLAIGAQARDVVRQVMTQGLWLVSAGLVLGTAGAAALARVLRGLLVGVSAGDPFVFGGAAALLLAVASLAVYLPARRASRVDPLVALRQD